MRQQLVSSPTRAEVPKTQVWATWLDSLLELEVFKTSEIFLLEGLSPCGVCYPLAQG
jgi:hypothetical protein